MAKARRRRWLVAAVVGAGALVLAVLAASAWRASHADADLAAIEQIVRLRFPEVRQISTQALSAELERPDPPLLLDVRTAAEHEVSHLPGARRVEPDEALPAWLLTLPRTTPIVAYCAVGYRSSAYARRLEAAGFSDVANLEGSIFAWANEDRPLLRGEAPVSVVHPFDQTWGRLLDEAKRAELPP